MLASHGSQKSTQWHPNMIFFIDFPPLVKHYHDTEEDDYDNSFKITCQCCNGLVICTGKGVELIYINFSHAVMSKIGIYTEELFT